MVVFSCHGKLLNALCKTSPMTPRSVSTLDAANLQEQVAPQTMQFHAVDPPNSMNILTHPFKDFNMHHHMPCFHFTPSKPSIFNKPAMQPAITSLGPRVTGRFHLPLVRVSFKPAYMTTICINSPCLNL